MEAEEKETRALLEKINKAIEDYSGETIARAMAVFITSFFLAFAAKEKRMAAFNAFMDIVRKNIEESEE